MTIRDELLEELEAGGDEAVLDDLVYDIAINIALGDLNATDDEDQQDDIITTRERLASAVNNEGYEAQVDFLFENGVPFEDIREVAARSRSVDSRGAAQTAPDESAGGPDA